MRPVDKGDALQAYRNYGEARHDLAGRLGYYCSYCEMKVRNSLEVEHVLPRNQGGAPVDWNNFLLSCKYCNTIKGDHNDNLEYYFWPDRDNTDLAFDYSEARVIEPSKNLSDDQKALAESTIRLMGLDRIPGGREEPTPADTRWRSREEVWFMAKGSLKRWHAAPIPEMAEQIASGALGCGHYSIWMKIFEQESEVLLEIDEIYRTKGLFKEFAADGSHILRENARI